jgi:hypothetical protein
MQGWTISHGFLKTLFRVSTAPTFIQEDLRDQKLTVQAWISFKSAHHTQANSTHATYNELIVQVLGYSNLITKPFATTCLEHQVSR